MNDASTLPPSLILGGAIKVTPLGVLGIRSLQCQNVIGYSRSQHWQSSNHPITFTLQPVTPCSSCQSLKKRGIQTLPLRKDPVRHHLPLPSPSFSITLSNALPRTRAPRCFDTVLVDNAPKSFPKFGELPPELQLRVWEFALANCYLLAADTQETSYMGFNGRRVTKMETVVVRRLVGRRWDALRGVCRMSFEVAKGVAPLRRQERLDGDGGEEKGGVDGG